MKVYNDSINFKTVKGISFTDITDLISSIAKKAVVKDGVLFIFAPHATGAIIINEYDDYLLNDIRRFLERLVPPRGIYEHPDNAPSHILSSLLTPSLVIPITQGRLQLGTWQSIIWVEVEPWQRTRNVKITVIGE